jgi:hypothetical protein
VERERGHSRVEREELVTRLAELKREAGGRLEGKSTACVVSAMVNLMAQGNFVEPSLADQKHLFEIKRIPVDYLLAH